MSMSSPIPELLNTFHLECERAFAFLVTEHHFTRQYGLSDFELPRANLKYYDLKNIPNWFWAVERFERCDVRIEISFGDREFNIEGRYWNKGQEFALWEILQAADHHSEAISGDAWVNTTSFMSDTLQHMARALHADISLFLNPQPFLFDRALTLRNERLRQAYEIQRLQELDRARTIASEAFRAKDYVRVVTLLTPFTDILTAADRRKIELSKRYAS